MITIAGYNIIESLYTNDCVTIYRGTALNGTVTRILKMVRCKFDDPHAHKLKHEYDMLSYIFSEDPETAEKIQLVRVENGMALITEDTGGHRLDRLFTEPISSIEKFIYLAIELSKMIQAVHKKCIIHNNLNLSNIIFNEKNNKIMLTDFSASVFTEKVCLKQPGIIESGDFEFTSPERTGRINLSVDERSDLYSLGVIFYRLFSGRLPFESQNPAELIHSHLAIPPEPIHKMNTVAESLLSKAIMKLLEKAPDNRFSSATELLEGLSACKKFIFESSKHYFSIDQNDKQQRLRIPETIFGRNKERQLIIDAWNSVKFKSVKQVVSLSGEPGVGKTGLIHNIFFERFNHEENAIWGKFDQAMHNTPYSVFITAFQTLIDRILGKNQKEFDIWKNTLKRVLGSNGQLVINIYPDLEKIIGPQPPVASLSPIAEKNRFDYVFKKFIGAFSNKNAPLILFIDDLQWADSASMEVIRSICLEEVICPLLLITAFREKEMPSSHGWNDLIKQMAENNVSRLHFHLSPLAPAQVSEIICKTLNITSDCAEELSETTLLKTRGNPQFIKDFLNFIYHKKLIWYDAAAATWKWNLNSIKMARISDSAAGIIKQHIRTLGGESQRLLKLAACLGNRFSLKTLIIGSGKDARQVQDLVEPLVREGIINLYKTVEDKDSNTKQKKNIYTEQILYSFSHDIIQQEALHLFDQFQLEKKQWQIGNRFLVYFNKKIPREYKSVTTDLLNAGSTQCRYEEEKLALARLNNECGKSALENIAYQAAYDYFHKGISLVQSSISNVNKSIVWGIDFSLSLSLYEGCAHAVFLLSRFDELDDLFRLMDENIADMIQKTFFYELKIGALFARNRMEEAIDLTLDFSSSLGIHFPQKTRKFHVIAAFLKTRILLFNKKADDLERLPLMTDPAKLAALRVINSAILAFHTVRPDLMALIVFKSIQLSVRYGITETCVFGYAGYGLTLCGRFNRIEEGISFGRLALRLVEKHRLKSIEARTNSVFQNFIIHWKDDLKNIREHLLNNYKIGLETGDHQFACICAYSFCSSGFFCGESLEILNSQLNKSKKIIQNLNNAIVLHSMNILLHAISQLTSDSRKSIEKIGDLKGIKTDLKKIVQSNDLMGLFNYYHLSMMMSYLFQKIDNAVDSANSARKHFDVIMGMVDSVNFIFYETLSRISFLEFCPASLKKSNLRQVKSNVKLFQKWADLSPGKFAHKLYLLKARLFELKNNSNKANRFYDLAVTSSGKTAYVHDRSVIMESAGRFYLRADETNKAGILLKQAYDNYLIWGAVAKANDMKLKYPPYLFQTDAPQNITEEQNGDRKIHKRLGDDMITSYTVDIHTILKASQAIAKETQFDVLMDSLIRSILENSGASKAVLLMYSNNTLKMEVGAKVNPLKTEIMGSVPFDDSTQKLPVSIIHYVKRTDQSIILNNALQSDEFGQDPYVKKNRPISILCSPIYNKNMKAGMLYLENNFIQGTFSEERLKILNILISQAVVSIENAMLFKTLDREKIQKEAAVGEIKLQKRLIENMSSQIVMLEERERKALADDLHDSASQLLSICLLNLQQLKRELSQKQQHELESTHRLLKKALQEIRSITFQLSPKVLHEFGLTAAIDWLAEDLYVQTSLECTFFNKLTTDIDLNETVNVTIYRAVRELLINIVKHAETMRAQITLSDENQMLRLTVEDGGRGFALDSQQFSKDIQHNGYGLWRIKEKIHALNGSVSIGSHLGKGTRVTIRVPIS